MSTTFTFKATKATENKDVQYAVDLGVDILEGKTQSEKDDAAEHTFVVNVQNHKGSLLRQSTCIEDAEKTLHAMGYTDATVELHIPTSKPKGMVIDGVEYSKEDIAKLIKLAKSQENK